MARRDSSSRAVDDSPNTPGLISMILALVSPLVCCVLSPPAMIVGFFGLGHPKKATAITGVVVGGLGTLALIGAVVAMITGGAAALPLFGDMMAPMMTKAVADGVRQQVIEKESNLGERMPDDDIRQLLELTTANQPEGFFYPIEYEVDASGSRRLVSPGKDGELETEDDIIVLIPD